MKKNRSGLSGPKTGITRKVAALDSSLKAIRKRLQDSNFCLDYGQLEFMNTHVFKDKDFKVIYRQDSKNQFSFEKLKKNLEGFTHVENVLILAKTKEKRNMFGGLANLSSDFSSSSTTFLFNLTEKKKFDFQISKSSKPTGTETTADRSRSDSKLDKAKTSFGKSQTSNFMEKIFLDSKTTPLDDITFCLNDKLEPFNIRFGHNDLNISENPFENESSSCLGNSFEVDKNDLSLDRRTVLAGTHKFYLEELLFASVQLKTTTKSG